MNVQTDNSNKLVEFSNLANAEDYSNIESFIQYTNRFSYFFPYPAYIIDYYKQKFIYVSEEFSRLCGIPVKAILKSGFLFYLTHIPMEELVLLNELNNVWLSFLARNSLQRDVQKKYSISFNVHLKSLNKNVILINHILFPLTLDVYRNIRLAFCVISYSASKNINNIIFEQRDENKSYEYNIKTKQWLTKKKIKLSEQEFNVLLLSAQGLTIDKVAEELRIKQITVKFHRKNILYKMGVKNISEAIMRAINNKLLFSTFLNFFLFWQPTFF